MHKITFWTVIIFIAVISIIVLLALADNDDIDLISKGHATDAAFRDGTYLGMLAARRGEPVRVSFRRWAIEPNQRSFIVGYQAGYKKILEENARKQILALNAQAAFRDGLYVGKLDAEHDRSATIPSGRWSRGDDRLSFDLGYRQSYEKAIAERDRFNDRRNLASTQTASGSSNISISSMAHSRRHAP